MLFEARDISFRYDKKSPWLLKNVSLKVNSGEIVGITAPSGYGKSTLAKVLAGYEKASSGSVTIDGEQIPEKVYCPVQLIFQHPETSVNPRWKMDRILNEAGEVSEAVLEKLGIHRQWLTRWPSELSGGELQRFCIARVLNDRTRFLICDEITTMLDAITQAQIWEVLKEFTKSNDMGVLVITHNPHIIERVCDRVIDLAEINKC